MAALKWLNILFINRNNVMTSIVKKFAVLLFVISVTGLAGCASLTGGGDPSITGDLLTERSITRALYESAELSNEQILVGCVDGVVTLTGVVDSQVDKQLAERIALGVSGVQGVNNNLSTRS